MQETDDNGHVGELIVVTGPPGAGKSTVARLLVDQFDLSALVLGDAFFGFVTSGYVAPWTAEADRQNTIVVGAAAAAAGRLSAGGYAVVYDGVIGPWFLDAFTQAAGLGSVHYVMLLPPEQTCVERVQRRTDHGFTDLDATRHMYREFAKSEIDARHIMTGSQAPDITAAVIFQSIRDGTLRTTEALPA
jgi:adenylate kinase family enzyme